MIIDAAGLTMPGATTVIFPTAVDPMDLGCRCKACTKRRPAAPSDAARRSNPAPSAPAERRDDAPDDAARTTGKGSS